MSDDARYPKNDLDPSIEVARQLHQRGGGQASGDELATFLGYKSTNNGAYLSRVASARYFGLVEGISPAIKVTPLAMDILRPDYPESAQRARITAFLSVPLFRRFLDEVEGKPMPDAQGIKNILNRLGVPDKETSPAMLRLIESADQAGLFRIAGNRSKMIRPSANDAPDRPQTRAATDRATATDTATATIERTTSAAPFPKIIEGALDSLPRERTWDESELEEWLAFFEGALRVHYRLPRGRREPG